MHLRPAGKTSDSMDIKDAFIIACPHDTESIKRGHSYYPMKLPSNKYSLPTSRLSLLSLFIFAAAFLVGGNLKTVAQTASPSDSIQETPAQRDARLEWWRDARFGMFIHWGLYSEAAGYWGGSATENGGMSRGAGEWIMNDMRIPRDQYATLAARFDPVNFNADTWVRIAKQAGMKYLVITSKHHDGFCMFKTTATPYNVVNATPWHTDPLAALSQACRRQGVKFCVYYSIMDWHSPDQQPANPDPEHPTYNPTSFVPGKKAAYIQYMETELKELITQYHPALIWFDGQWMNGWTDQDGQALYHYLRTLDPTVIINDRVKGAGDYETPEQYIPPGGLPGRNWETCMTMNDTWGYKRNDNNWKSTETLIRNLIDCASKGGNYLLNVGPTDLGVIPPPSVERLQQIGSWMKINGSALYDTTASPFQRQLPWGRCTKKITGGETTLYLHVWNWPSDGKLLVPGLQNEISTAYLLEKNFLGWHHHLTVANSPDGVTLSVPATAPDPISTTIVLKFKGAPDLVTPPVSQASDGTVRLNAADASLHGGTIQYEAGDGHDNIGYWTDPNDWISWTVTVTHPGRFKASAIVAATDSTAFEFSVAGQTLRGTVPVTGSYMTYQPMDLGAVDLPATGSVTFDVHAVKDGWQPLNLKSIELTPEAGNP